jgi:hypothetical protein
MITAAHTQQHLDNPDSNPTIETSTPNDALHTPPSRGWTVIDDIEIEEDIVNSSPSKDSDFSLIADIDMFKDTIVAPHLKDSISYSIRTCHSYLRPLYEQPSNKAKSTDLGRQHPSQWISS